MSQPVILHPGRDLSPLPHLPKRNTCKRRKPSNWTYPLLPEIKQSHSSMLAPKWNTP